MIRKDIVFIDNASSTTESRSHKSNGHFWRLSRHSSLRDEANTRGSFAVSACVDASWGKSKTSHPRPNDHRYGTKLWCWHFGSSLYSRIYHPRFKRKRMEEWKKGQEFLAFFSCFFRALLWLKISWNYLRQSNVVCHLSSIIMWKTSSVILPGIEGWPNLLQTESPSELSFMHGRFVCQLMSSILNYTVFSSFYT